MIGGVGIGATALPTVWQAHPRGERIVARHRIWEKGGIRRLADIRGGVSNIRAPLRKSGRIGRWNHEGHEGHEGMGGCVGALPHCTRPNGEEEDCNDTDTDRQ
jgi:hypothetical protein